MDEQLLETKRRAISDLKHFARAEMARDLAKRHGRSLRLPWDVDEPAAVDPKPGALDEAALAEAAGLGLGD